MSLSRRLAVADPFAADAVLEEVQDALGVLVEERLAHWTRREADPAWMESEAGRHTFELIQVAIAVSEGLAAMRTLIVSGSGGDTSSSGEDSGIFP